MKLSEAIVLPMIRKGLEKRFNFKPIERVQFSVDYHEKDFLMITIKAENSAEKKVFTKKVNSEEDVKEFQLILKKVKRETPDFERVAVMYVFFDFKKKQSSLEIYYHAKNGDKLYKKFNTAL